MKITVLGAGAWGTALAKVLHENGNAVTLWDIATDTLKEIQGGRSERYLPGVKLPADWKAEPDFQKAVAGAECCRDGDSVAIIPAGCREIEGPSGHFCHRHQGRRI